MSINLSALMKQRYDTAANWTAQNPTLLAGEIGIESDTKKWKVGTGATAWTSLAYAIGGTYPIVNADIAAGAAIVDTKLATIATAGKVSNSATTAASANTASAIVARDASGNFTAGTITAALTGAASANVLKAGDTMTGVLAVTAGTAALPGIAVSGDPNTGIYSPGADQLAISTGGTVKATVDSSGRLLVGTATAFDATANALIQAATTNGAFACLGNSNTSVLANENLGLLRFFSRGGSVWEEGARIEAEADLDHASGDKPTRLVFSTTADGGADPTPRMTIDNAGNLKFNSGYGSVATVYGCRAWVNFNGTGTVAIRASGNVSSITDSGVGRYIVNFTTAMVDANYAVTSTASGDGYVEINSGTYSTTAIAIAANTTLNVGVDQAFISVAVFR